MSAPTELTSDPQSFLGPTYNYAEELSPPSDIGVKVGDSFDQVYTNIKGVNYYVDAIGFGQGTFLNDNPMKPLGLKFFLNTGFTCSNGANRYEYIDTTPQGDSLGSIIQKELKRQGLPELRGLAPGMLEDAEIALNPLPLFRAALGDTGYCSCVLDEKRVGDGNGSVEGRSCVEDNPSSPPGGVRSCAWMKPDYWKDAGGKVYDSPGSGRIPYQKRWVKLADISQEQFDATPKTYNPDGTSRSSGNVLVDQVRAAGGLEPFSTVIVSTISHPEATHGKMAAVGLTIVAALIAIFGFKK